MRYAMIVNDESTMYREVTDLERQERFFNTAGPMIPEDHYCIDPLTRIDWEEIQRLIRDERYFVLHAPRQTGKTSTLLALMRLI